MFDKGLFGGMFDFNSDGKEDLGEQWNAHKIFEECMKDEDEDDNDDSFFDDSDYSFDSEDKYSWRDTCVDGIEYNVYPEDYETEEEYLAKTSTTETTIYDFKVQGFTEDINEWQINKIGEFFQENKDVFGGMTAADSVKNHTGFYYKSLVAPKDTTSFKKDSVIYINYTGRLLDGTVFDTTNERLAKDSGIWSSSRKYAPTQIKWGEKYSDITMGSSSSKIIAGFGLTLWQMREFEKGVGVFTSEYGYGYSGSGESIPGFAPLIFEIEIVPEPED